MPSVSSGESPKGRYRPMRGASMSDVAPAARSAPLEPKIGTRIGHGLSMDTASRALLRVVAGQEQVGHRCERSRIGMISGLACNHQLETQTCFLMSSLTL